jgi:branched-chain amino acid transport system permease protein
LFVLEPSMAESVGPIVFVVVVVGGMGSLGGALAASLLIGCVQTFAVSTSLPIGQIAPVLPYVLLVAMLALRPRGLFGHRADHE